ncbi:MAG TPA: hypothetical protein VFW07_10325 [Parafilimonas sp.]|nr:hypothetical protein [Parafilimonas sp.]
MKTGKASLLFLFMTASFCVHAQTADEIISKYISCIGGAEKWKAIKTIVMTGTYNYGGIEFPFTSYSKAPDKYKYIVPSGGKSFTQAFNGTKGWKIDGFNNETVKTILTGRSARAMSNEADVELESPFLDYQKKGNKIILEGEDSVEGARCFTIKLIRNEGDTEMYHFNAATYELAEKQAVSKNPELDGSIVNIFYSDYRVVEGIKIPFKSVSKIGDQIILTIAVQKIDINVPVEDSEFEP